ncbi:MAG: TIGR02234 family membrane protein, partial [Actinomycetes bacterium]
MSGSAARRELTSAVLASAVAGGLALFAAGQTWVTYSVLRRAPLPPVSGALEGSSYAPVVPAAGLVLLAAAVALLAVRGHGRFAVGALVALGGAVLAWTGARALGGGLEEAAAGDQTVVQASVIVTSSAWPLATLSAGLVGALAGLLVVVRGRRWPAMGERYERRATPGGTATVRPRTDEDRAQLAWQALDRGEDPTAPPADRGRWRNGPGPLRPPPGRAGTPPSLECVHRSAAEGTEVRQ